MFFSIARRIFTLLAISTLWGSIGFTVNAQTTDWPRQPITLGMTFPAGSGVDVVARQIQEPLGK